MHRRQRNAVIERDERLALFVRDRLAEGWSPQQISGWLRSGVEAGLRTVAMETIYAFIYRADQKADKLWRYLTRRRRTRRALRTRPSRDTIKNRVSIHERPENVNNRSQIGNWEADTSSIFLAARASTHIYRCPLERLKEVKEVKEVKNPI